MTEQQFKSLLRQRMQEKGINQSKLSELSGVSTGLISGWFNGKHDITFRKVLKICEVLDVVVFEGVRLPGLDLSHNWKRNIKIENSYKFKDEIFEKWK